MQNPWDNDPVIGASPFGSRPVIHERAPQPAPRHPDDARKSQIDADIAVSTRPDQIRKARADARAAEASAAKAERELGPPPKLPPSQLKSVRADAIAKINQVRTIRRKLGDGGVRQGDFLPETGIIGKVLSKTGYGSAAEIAARVKTLESGAALTTIKKWIAETGKNPLTPMSEADTKLLSQDTGNLDLNQPEESFRSALDAFEQAYSNAYLGAGGRPDVLQRGKKKQKPRVIDFNSLPE